MSVAERRVTGPGHDSVDSLRTAAASLFPGGVNSPVRSYRAVGGDPPTLVRGSGARVWDLDGREYIDLVGAFGPLILGHAHPAVVEAIQRAAAAGGPFAVTGPPEVALGERIRDAMPSVERLRFVNSGTEAVMSAIRVARAATGRDIVLKFEGAYHGHVDGLLATAGSGLAALSLPASAGVPVTLTAMTLLAPYNDLDAVEATLDAHAGRVAAVIVEPIAANMGVIPPADGFLEGLRSLTRRHGSLLIFDEVITGFRVARGGAQDLYGIDPDLTVLGKVIGGGLPVGAYGGRRAIMQLVAPEGPVYQAGTLAAHPIAMAAGCAALDLLTDDVYSELDARAGRLAEGLSAAAREAGRDVSVTRVGSLLTLFFRRAPPRSLAEVREADRDEFARFHRAMRSAGVLLPPAGEEAWFLSAAHDDEVIERIIGAARIAFRG